MSANVAVVVPLYRSPLSADEQISLAALRRALPGHEHIALVPVRLMGAAALEGFSRVVTFADEHFASVQSYNQLMLNAAFYRCFEAYEHILIYQTDALVFSDELAHWCAQPYDYIGAPWVYSWAFWPLGLGALKKAKALRYQARNLRWGDKARRKWCALRVGNGGFSLRRVRTFLDVLENPPAIYREYIERGLQDYPEDFFWGIDANAERPRIRVPDWQTALGFAVESAPEQAIKRLGKLPFGAHAWDRGYRDYWLRTLAQTSGG